MRSLQRRLCACYGIVCGQHALRMPFTALLLYVGMWVLVGATAIIALVLTVQFQRALYLEGVRGADKWLWLFRGVDLGGMGLHDTGRTDG